MKFALLLLAALCAATPALAEQKPAKAAPRPDSRMGAAPIVYNRSVITFLPKPAAEAPAAEAPPQDKIALRVAPPDKPEEAAPPPAPRQQHEYVVDVRTPEFLSQRDFIAQQAFADREGIMVALDPVRIFALKSSQMLATVDVLFVDEDGLIVQLAPSLPVNNLTDEIHSKGAVKAIVFLNAGAATLHDIRVGDSILNEIFRTHPVVLQ